MSGKLMGQVYGLQLTRTEREVLLALCQRANDDGTRVFPSAGLLAWELDFSERHIRRVLEALEGKDLIRIVAYPSGGRGKATRYEIHLENGTLKPPRRSDENPDISDQNPDICEENPDTQMSAFNKEADAKPGHFGIQNPDISDQNPDIWMSDEPSVEEPPKESSVSSSETPARERFFAPDRLSKQYFARRPAGGQMANGHSPPAASEVEPSTIPTEFIVDFEMQRWAQGKATEYDVGLDPSLLADKFLNYYRRGRGKQTEQLDWEGCWRDWVIRDIEKLAQQKQRSGGAKEGIGTNGANQPGRPETPSERMVRQIGRIGQELQAHADGGHNRPFKDRARP